MLANFFNSFMILIEQLDYWSIALLMTVESSFIPFPSELVIPPAAYLAQQGNLNIILVILAGVLGSLIGALINYFLAFTLGRTILYKLVKTKLARTFLITEHKLEKSENYFLKYGETSTFFGRLVPVIRQLISIPAGLAKMQLSKFCLFTFLGSSVWVIILALLGYYFAQEQALILFYYQEILLGLLIIVIVFIFIKKIKTKQKKKRKIIDQEKKKKS